MLISSSNLARSLKVGSGAVSSIRQLSISTPARGTPLQQVFRNVANSREPMDFHRAKERMRGLSRAGKLSAEISAVTWKVVVERWPIDEAIPLLSEPRSQTVLLPPFQTVQPMRDLARRFLSDATPPSFATIRSLQILLERHAPDDPFTLLLLLSAYHALPPQPSNRTEHRQTIQSVTDQIMRCMRTEGRWTFFPAEEGAPNPGDENWGLKREPPKKHTERAGALEFGVVESKAALKALDELIEKAKEGLVEPELLGWYATQPSPSSSSPRFHRSRLYNYLLPLTDPAEQETSPSPLPLPLLNIFLYPALLHQGSDPLVNIFALQALLLISSSPTTSTSEREAAQEAIKSLLAKVEKVADWWTSKEHGGVGVRQTLGAQCLKRLQDSGLMYEDQKGMWDKVFGKEEVQGEGKEVKMAQ